MYLACLRPWDQAYALMLLRDIMAPKCLLLYLGRPQQLPESPQSKGILVPLPCFELHWPQGVSWDLCLLVGKRRIEEACVWQHSSGGGSEFGGSLCHFPVPIPAPIPRPDHSPFTQVCPLLPLSIQKSLCAAKWGYSLPSVPKGILLMLRPSTDWHGLSKSPGCPQLVRKCLTAVLQYLASVV